MSLLFEPGRIGNMTVKNHFVSTAVKDNLCTPDGECTNGLINFYRQLADGGTGLIVTGAAYIHPLRQAGQVIGLYDDKLIEGYQKLTRAVHAYSTKIVANLFLPKNTDLDFLGELTEAEIQEFITAFGQAARRAREAGFDGIQLHAAHGCLIHSFLSPYTNRRTDCWGGSRENNLRFPIASYRKCREAVGEDYPIMVKIIVQDYLEGGITLDLGKCYAEKLNAAGFNAIDTSFEVDDYRPCYTDKDDLPANGHISGNNLERIRQVSEHVSDFEEVTRSGRADLRPLAREIKKVVDIPVILPGDNQTVANMDDTLQSGDADFIGLCFPLVREPDFPNKIMKRVFFNNSW